MADLVRLRCGATGISIGAGLGLYVSAQDNDLCTDDIDPGREPQPGLPVPTDAEVIAARAAVRGVARRKSVIHMETCPSCSSCVAGDGW